MDITPNNISIHNTQYGLTCVTNADNPIHLSSMQPNALLYNYKLYIFNSPSFKTHDLKHYTPHFAVVYNENNIVVYSEQRHLLSLISIDHAGNFSQQLILTMVHIKCLSLESDKICVVLSNGITALIKFYMLDCLQGSYSYAFEKNIILIRQWFAESCFDECSLYHHYGLQLYISKLENVKTAAQSCNMVALLDESIHIICFNNRYFPIKPSLNVINAYILNSHLIAAYLVNNTFAIYRTDNKQLAFILMPNKIVMGIKLTQNQNQLKSSSRVNDLQNIITTVESNGYIYETCIPQQRIDRQFEITNKSAILVNIDKLQSRISTTPIIYGAFSDSCLVIINSNYKMLIYRPSTDNAKNIPNSMSINESATESTNNTNSIQQTNRESYNRRKLRPIQISNQLNINEINNPNLISKKKSAPYKSKLFHKQLKKINVKAISKNHKEPTYISNEEPSTSPHHEENKSQINDDDDRVKQGEPINSESIENYSQSLKKEENSARDEMENKCDSRNEIQSELISGFGENSTTNKHNLGEYEYDTRDYNITLNDVGINPANNKNVVLPLNIKNSVHKHRNLKKLNQVVHDILAGEVLLQRKKRANSYYSKYSVEHNKATHNSSFELRNAQSNLFDQIATNFKLKSRKSYLRKFSSVEQQNSNALRAADNRISHFRKARFSNRKGSYLFTMPKMLNYCKCIAPKIKFISFQKLHRSVPDIINPDAPSYFIPRPTHLSHRHYALENYS